METIEIKNIYGDVIFKHTAENNSVKLTVEAAVSCGVLLAWANLANADLREANLAGAKLTCADLYSADLYRANLADAKLSWANLAGAKLEGSELDRANLYEANLKCADLYRANLSWANLAGAKLEGSELDRANLNGAKNIPFIPLACPSEGAFIGWKKVDGYFLVKLQIPEDARRLSATTRKCRCDKAMVLDITSLDGETHFDEVVNYKYKKTTYKVGEIVYPDSFDDNRWNECSNGIHFFINKEDAINY